MNVNNLVYDRARSGYMRSNVDGRVLFRLTDIGSANLSMTGENEEVVDATGSPIMDLSQSKGATFSGDSLFSLDLLAAQAGTEKIVADENNKIETPFVRIYPVTQTSGAVDPIVLEHDPISPIKFIYKVGTGSNLGERYKLGTDVSTSEFTYDAATKTIVLPTGVEEGKILIEYKYMSAEAMEVNNKADTEAYSGEFILKALFRDTCAKEKKYAGWIIFPNANLDNNVDIDFSPTGRHPFELKALQDYCADEGENKLFRIVIEDDE